MTILLDDILDRLPALVRSSLGDVQIVCAITKGHGSVGWHLAGPEGQYYVKAELRADRLDSVLAAVSMAIANDVPTPAVRHVERDIDHDEIVAVTVMDWVDGTDLGVALKDLSPIQLEAVGSSIGSNLAKMHQIHLPGFAGSLSESQADGITWPDYLRLRFSKVAERYAREGVPRPPAPVSELMREALDVVAALDGCTITPTLVHRDLWQDNIIVRPSFETSFIDFEQSKAWDPAADFAKLELLVFAAEPRLSESVYTSYLAGLASPPEAFTSRIYLAVALEIVWGLPFFIRWDDRVAEDKWLEHAKALLSRPFEPGYYQ